MGEGATCESGIGKSISKKADAQDCGIAQEQYSVGGSEPRWSRPLMRTPCGALFCPPAPIVMKQHVENVVASGIVRVEGLSSP